MKRSAAILLIVVLLSLVLLGQSRYTAVDKVLNSRHDFSVSSTGATYKAAPPSASPNTQTCVFCHTPHHANPAVPLWNHAATAATYTRYASTTLQATVNAPTSADSSILCLSCHDGTVALGNTVNNGTIAMTPSSTLPSTARSYIGTNLADDHPLAFAYTPPVAPAYPQVQNPAGSSGIFLDGGKVECISCHNPHQENVDTTELRFLRINNSGSAICTACHALQGNSGGANSWNWNNGPSSDHKTRTNTYNLNTNDPGDSDSSFLGSHTGYATTDTNACEACHRPHTAHINQRLLKAATAQVCFQCHQPNATGGGTNAANIHNPPANTVIQDIKSSFNAETYKHPGSTVAGSSGTSDAGHDPAETLPISSNRHAACDDCHNGHAAQGYESGGGVFPVPPNLPSSLWGVGGIKSDGTSRTRTSGNDDARYQYEICFKCHADSTNKPQTTDVSTAGIGYGRQPKRMWDFSGASNCTTPLSTRANTRNEFANHTPYVSYHPVVDALNHTAANDPPYGVPSLRPFVQDVNGVNITSRPLTASSVIYCTDCHNNDNGRDAVATRTGTAMPAGPHGSANIHILERTNLLETPPATQCSGASGSNANFSLTNYKLCDKCHDITNSIRNDRSFGRHQLHTGLTPCSTCHDPHASQYLALINFDKSIVGPSNGVISFTKKTSTQNGSCTLNCHGHNHNPETY